MNYKTEKVGEGKFDVTATGKLKEYPRRIGFIIGGGKTWQAERGPHNLGYFASKRGALAAIVAAYEKIMEEPAK